MVWGANSPGPSLWGPFVTGANKKALKKPSWCVEKGACERTVHVKHKAPADVSELQLNSGRQSWGCPAPSKGSQHLSSRPGPGGAAPAGRPHSHLPPAAALALALAPALALARRQRQQRTIPDVKSMCVCCLLSLPLSLSNRVLENCSQTASQCTHLVETDGIDTVLPDRVQPHLKAQIFQGPVCMVQRRPKHKPKP